MKKLWLATSAILSIGCYSCSSFAENKDAALGIAQRSEIYLTNEDIRAATQQIATLRSKVLIEEAKARENLAKELLQRRTLAAQARKDSFESNPMYAARLRVAYERILSDLYLEFNETVDLDTSKLERMAREEYRAYPERYRRDEVNVRHILAAAHPSCQNDPFETIKALVDRIKAGESFEDLAQQYSDDIGSGAKGGDLGWVGRGRMVKPFEDGMFALKQPGDLSEPIRTEFGVHLIKLVERKDAVAIPFDEVKNKIVDGLILKHRQAKRDSVMEELNDPATYRFDDAALEDAVKSAVGPNVISPPGTNR